MRSRGVKLKCIEDDTKEKSEIGKCLPEQIQQGHLQGEIQIATLASISGEQPWLMGLAERPLMC